RAAGRVSVAGHHLRGPRCGRSSCKRFAVAVAADYFAERLALLLALADGAGGIAERYDAKDIEAVGNAEDPLRAFQAAETSPVRPAAFRPGRYHHRLSRPARVRHRKAGVLDAH